MPIYKSLCFYPLKEKIEKPIGNMDLFKQIFIEGLSNKKEGYKSLSPNNSQKVIDKSK